MFFFADNAWHVISVAGISVLGIWLALAQKPIFGIGQRQALLFYLWHTIFCLFYFYYSLDNVADSRSYFSQSVAYLGGFDFGTSGIYWLTSFFSAGVGFSYGGTFLVYNLFGYIGMLAFAAALTEVTARSSRHIRRLALLIILLPGLSFWSVAIGKDALTLMGTGLATWGALNFSRRYPALVVAALAFLLARPHMAGIMLASDALALLFASRDGLIKKTLLLLVALPSAAIAVIFGAQFAGLGEATSAEDIVSYFEERQGHNLGGGSSVDIAGMSLPLRLLTYLYRPFFFDAGGLMGFVVSFENLLLAIVTLCAFLLSILGRKSNLNRFAVLFFVVFSLLSLFVLANSTANLGIAIRQKWMFLPMLLLLCMSVFVSPGRDEDTSPRLPRHFTE